MNDQIDEIDQSNESESPTERLLNFSLHPKIFNKSPNINLSASGWVHIEGTIDQLIEAVTEWGMAFSYVYEDGKRSVANFLGTDVVAIDIDGGWNLYKFLEHDLIKAQCAFVYTTPSHDPEEHRFRAVFTLPRTITTSSELTRVSNGLIRRFLSDPATKDAARVWYGCEGAEVHRVDAVMTAEFLEELLLDESVVPTSESVTNTVTTAARSTYRFPPDMIVTKADGTRARAGSLKKRQSIYCFAHRDEKASAFIARNSKGSTFIHCVACAKTWWMKSNLDIQTRSLITDFTSFERILKEIKDGGISRNALEHEKRFGHTTKNIHPDNIELSDTQFLKVDHLQSGVTFIKSPKGSGKTTFLADIVKDAIFPDRRLGLEQIEELYAEEDQPIRLNSGAGVLLIGHRQALIGDLCSKLGLNCYLDDDGKSEGEVRRRKRQYGVCLDSLPKVQHSLYSDDARYSIVVIDEVEQVLAHFLSETIGSRRGEIFRLFSEILGRATQIVALDADLGWTSFITISTLAKKKKKNPATKKLMTEFSPVTVYVNQFKETDRSIEMFPNESQITEALLGDIEAGRRVFITTNSKRKAKSIGESILEFTKEKGVERSVLTITAENSKSKAIQSFIADIKTEILKYDVVVTSPSLGTGVDITFENGSREIDGVYGLFEARINSHFEVDQQLARVRNPGFVRAWISPQVFSFETEFDVVKEDFITDQAANSVFRLGESSLSPVKGGLSPFLMLGTLVTMQQRASKNLLRKNFVDHKVNQGWKIVEIPKDEDAMKIGKLFRRLGRQISQQKRVDEILAAKTIDESVFRDIEDRLDSRGSEVTREEFISFYRTKMELSYGERVSQELIEKDDEGRLRSAIWKYCEFRGSPDYRSLPGIGEDINQIIQSKIFEIATIRSATIEFLLESTPLFKNREFDTSAVISGDDLEEFAKRVIRLKNTIETHLGVAIEHNISEKPIRFLGKVLGVIGLNTKKGKPIVVNGEKTYFYSLDSDQLKFVDKIKLRRDTPGAAGWDFVNKEYGFTRFQGSDSEDGDSPDIGGFPQEPAKRIGHNFVF
jgi:hypothetical protein